jgi:hypothetical protein
MQIYRIAILVFFLKYSVMAVNAQTGDTQLTDKLYLPVIIESVELPVRDADGIALGDITGNGKIDILASEGSHGTTVWFEQGNSWKDWTLHHIHAIENTPHEIEGNALGDFDGDGRLEAISLNQPDGDIYLHKYRGDPRNSWQTSIIQSNIPLLQDAMITDIDGDGRPDLVYTWEGRNEGEGGVHWLKLTGEDALNPEHWDEYIMATHESAWWLGPRTVDLSGNGDATDIVFTARHLISRNPGSKPGLYWLEPAEDVTDTWILHTIDTAIPHPLHVDMGDLSGLGHGKDLVVSGFDTDIIYWYDFSEGWERHELEVPAINGFEPNRVWNVKTIRLGGPREGILAPVVEQGPNEGALLYYEFANGQFEPHILRELDYTHPMDDRIMLFDLTGDGQAEIFIPDSGPDIDTLHILRMSRDWPED